MTIRRQPAAKTSEAALQGGLLTQPLPTTSGVCFVSIFQGPAYPCVAIPPHSLPQVISDNQRGQASAAARGTLVSAASTSWQPAAKTPAAVLQGGLLTQLLPTTSRAGFVSIFQGPAYPCVAIPPHSLPQQPAAKTPGEVLQGGLLTQLLPTTSRACFVSIFQGTAYPCVAIPPHSLPQVISDNQRGQASAAACGTLVSAASTSWQPAARTSERSLQPLSPSPVSPRLSEDVFLQMSRKIKQLENEIRRLVLQWLLHLVRPWPPLGHLSLLSKMVKFILDLASKCERQHLHTPWKRLPLLAALSEWSADHCGSLRSSSTRVCQGKPAGVSSRRVWWENSPYHTSCQGVISEEDLLESSEDEILEGLSGQGVVAVRRISIRRDGQDRPSIHLVLTFASTVLPESIKAGYLHCKVRPYIPNPRRCFKCQRFGHSSISCRGKTTCAKCGGTDHPADTCEGTLLKCINCSGSHPTYSRACPKFQEEKKILALKIKENLTYPEARKRFSFLQGGTYAEAAARGAAPPLKASVGTQYSPRDFGCSTSPPTPSEAPAGSQTPAAPPKLPRARTMPHRLGPKPRVVLDTTPSHSSEGPTPSTSQREEEAMEVSVELTKPPPPAKGGTKSAPEKGDQKKKPPRVTAPTNPS
ncbi:hypothetical protein ISCGN_030007 [Ixodes scapularis]